MAPFSIHTLRQIPTSLGVYVQFIKGPLKKIFSTQECC